MTERRITERRAAPLATVGASRTFEHAMTYPYRMSQWKDRPENHPSRHPAHLLATDGTYPMRCVLDLLVPQVCMLPLPDMIDTDGTKLAQAHKRAKIEQQHDTVHLQYPRRIWIAAVYYCACGPQHATQHQAAAIHHTVRPTVTAATLLSNCIAAGDGTVLPSPVPVNVHLGRNCAVDTPARFVVTTKRQETIRSLARAR